LNISFEKWKFGNSGRSSIFYHFDERRSRRWDAPRRIGD
jgi:hypothetical protein